MAFVGIDVGGTRIKLGLVKQKKMVSSSVFEVKNNHSLEANLPLIIDEIKPNIRYFKFELHNFKYCFIIIFKII